MLPELRFSRDSLFRPEAEGFIVIRASHKSIAGDACRNRKLLVIQQVEINSTLLKATSCRNDSMFLLGDISVLGSNYLFISTRVVYFQQSILLCIYILIFFRALSYTILSSLTVPPWPKPQHIFLMFISSVTRRQAHIISVSRIILKNWNGFGTACIHPDWASGGHTS